MDRPNRRSVRRLGGLAAVVLGVSGTLVAVAPANAETLTVSPSGSFTVRYRGNGHGHGLSQYGAQGAAIAGKTYGQILSFYYPGTTLVTDRSRIIRVRISNTGGAMSIAARSNTTVTGVSGYLPTNGIAKYRLAADAGRGLTLQRLGSAAGSTWTNVRTGLPNGSEFYRHGGVPTRVYFTDGTTTDYDGFIRAVRVNPSGTGGGVYTVDRVTLDRYTAGVVPREMPASWNRAATDAQAVAARTYGSYAVFHPSHSDYDICDTSQCQVYGGNAHYSRTGALQWTNFLRPMIDTSNRILRYNGAGIFAQFSASDGGWTVSGGQPYLPAQADPYDNSASGDPYLNASKRIAVSSVARYFGLAKVTRISMTKRDGHGTWGGRVTAGSVTGTDANGKAKTVPATGFDFQDLFGLGTTWLTVVANS
jgi:stage II sporulation protein D